VLTTNYKIGATTDQSLTFAYDTGLNGKGHLVGASDANHSLTFSYDELGRLTNKTQTVGGNSKTVAYGYASGRQTSLLTPSGQSITYSYDTVGRLGGITLNGVILLNNIVHDPFGPITGWTWGNNSLTVRNYDLDGRLDLVDSAGLSTYSFFADGRIAGRLDDSVNSYSLSAGSSTLTPSSSSNHLTSAIGNLQRTYAYDAVGNTTSDGSANFTYNFANRMASASKAGVSATYTYNALGQRVRKQVGATTTYFFYDELGHLLGEYDGAGTLMEEIVWLEDIPVATIRPNGVGVQVFYIHTDHLNTPRRISRPADNVVVWRWDSDPFGEAPANDNPDGDANAFAFQLRFPGQFKDDESGLNYNYFRDYDPAAGRYAQSDPIGLQGGLNTFAYAMMRPTMAFDPLGLFKLSVNDSLRMVDVTQNGHGRWAWYVPFIPFPFGETLPPTLSVSCACKQECGSWKLNECFGALNIEVQIRNDLNSLAEAWTRSAEQEHVSDIRSGEASLYRAGVNAENSLQSKIFSTESECAAASKKAVIAALYPVASGLVGNSWLRRDKSGLHTYHGISPFK
jgi:RHS repeat-associated protein